MAVCRASSFEMLIERTVAFAISENAEGGVDLHLVEAETNDDIPGSTILRVVHNPYSGHFIIMLCEAGEMVPFTKLGGFIRAVKHPISSEYDATLKVIGEY